MTALSTALIMVPFLRKWALTTGTVDVPDVRKVHTTAVPRLGGIAIFIAFLFSLLVYADLAPAGRGLLAGALIIFVTGFIDDLHGITPRRKFLGEISGCLVTMVVGKLYITDLGNLFGFGVITLPLWLAIPFTLFAVVGVINAVNLIDGLDGLAGGVSVIAAAAFFILAWHAGNPSAMLLCAALLGAILGFLKYNYYPARIFMGDAGSLVVGFVLGFLAVMLTRGSGAVSPVALALVLGVPIIDTIWVMSSRLLKRQSPFSPDMTHVHHKFLNLGMEHRFTVIVIYGISLFWALVALLLHRVPEYLLLYGYLGITLLFYLALRFVLRHPGRFPWLQIDSHQGLRQSDFYREMAESADLLAPVLMGLYLIYLASGILFGGEGHEQTWGLMGVLFALGTGLLAWTRNERFSLVLVVLYIGNLILAFGIESFSVVLPMHWALFDRFSDPLFLVMAVLFAVKVLFRKDGELFLGGVELLCLGLAVFAGVVISNLNPNSELLTVLFKGMLLIMVLKVLIGYRPVYRRVAFVATFSALLVGMLQGMV
jgi:UDP-GlcNAc:undecaprenyl-phosphate GlcNAc-1-phosphate transferase